MMNVIGQQIKKFRIEKGYTQEQLGQLLGVSIDALFGNNDESELVNLSRRLSRMSSEDAYRHAFHICWAIEVGLMKDVSLIDRFIGFFSEKSGNKILVSKTMSDKLNIHAGSKVYGYFMTNDDVRMRKYTVSGVYQTNLSKYDEVMCFADLYSVVKLNGWEADQATGAELSIKQYDQLDQVLHTVTKKVNKHVDAYGETYCSATVEELNPQIFSWLDLLDLNVWIILALMVCVTGFTMISGLLIIILERVQMIGVLKALGARNGMVRHTFLWFAIFIIGKGMIVGNILGIGICLLQHYTGIVKLDPTIYYVAEVPVEINIPLFLLVNIATLLVSVLVLIIPSFLASHIRPAQSMRYE